MPADTEARGAPPKTGTEVVGTGLTPKVEIPGRGGMAGGGTMDMTGGATVGCITGAAGVQVAEVFPNESRKVVLRLQRTEWHNPHASAWHLFQSMLHDGGQAMVC